MPEYRRYFVKGASYFFTVKTEHNAPLFREAEHVRTLGNILREAREKWPFETNAIVLLPDHLHTIWTLPPNDDHYPTRWGWLKKEFTKAFIDSGGEEAPRSTSRVSNRRRGVWQRRYREHLIRDENDFEAHFDYIHWNPVKHGYVRCPRDWQYSSFHRWVKSGVYHSDWGCCSDEPVTSQRILDAGE